MAHNKKNIYTRQREMIKINIPLYFFLLPVMHSTVFYFITLFTER